MTSPTDNASKIAYRELIGVVDSGVQSIQMGWMASQVADVIREAIERIHNGHLKHDLRWLVLVINNSKWEDTRLNQLLLEGIRDIVLSVGVKYNLLRWEDITYGLWRVTDYIPFGKYTISGENRSISISHEAWLLLLYFCYENLSNGERFDAKKFSCRIITNSNNSVTLEFRDDGRGMSDELLKNLWGDPNQIFEEWISGRWSTGIWLGYLRQRFHELWGDISVRCESPTNYQTLRHYQEIHFNWEVSQSDMEVLSTSSNLLWYYIQAWLFEEKYQLLSQLDSVNKEKLEQARGRSHQPNAQKIYIQELLKDWYTYIMKNVKKSSEWKSLCFSVTLPTTPTSRSS